MIRPGRSEEMEDSSQDIYDRVAFLLDEVDARLDEGHADEGLELAKQAQKLLERNEEVRDKEIDLRIDTHYLLAASQFELGDIAAALREYEIVRKLDPRDKEIDYWEARALFHAWRFVEAERMLVRHKPRANTRAGALYYLALLADFRGEQAKADQLFSKAAKEDPDEYPEPVRMPEADVHSMLEDVLDALPRDVRRAIDGVDLALLPLPDPKIHASPDLDPLVLGVYRGVNLLEKSNATIPSDVDRIEIFQRNVERVVSDRDELREELRITLLHEIGHHLGWDEDDLAVKGLN
jgi:predicted Zn-dependent protease with MMP-like domain